MMGKNFDALYPRFTIQQGDRVTIEGAAFCFVDRVTDAWILRPADGVGSFQTFTFKALNTLSAAGAVLHEKGYFLDASLRTQPRRSEFSISTLSPKQRARLVTRDAFVQGFNELYDAGLVLKTEASITEHWRRSAPPPRPTSRNPSISWRSTGTPRRRPGSAASRWAEGSRRGFRRSIRAPS